MNRFFSLFLIFLLPLALCACGADASDDLPVPPTENISAPQQPLPEDGSNTEPETVEPSEPVADEESTVPSAPVVEEEPEEYVRTVDPYAPMVALTFDDGPHEIYSDQILDVLEANHSVATFFEVGYNARQYPDVLRRMVELGCEVASHSNAHHDLSTLSKNALLTDLDRLDRIIFDATGITPTLVRPPYGAVNNTVKYGTGRAMVTWTVDTLDWMYRDASSLIEYIQNYGDLDGEVVLMHSIHGSTAEAMETVIPWLIEQGYQLVTVSELMAYYYGELLEPNKFYNQTYFARHDRTEYPLELPDEPMQTLIPEYTTVPVTPIIPEEIPDTPPAEPAPDPAPPEGTPTPDTPPQTGETPDQPQDPSDPSQPETDDADPPADPPADPEEGGETENAPPAELPTPEEAPSEGTPSPDASPEDAPTENEPSDDTSSGEEPQPPADGEQA